MAVLIEDIPTKQNSSDSHVSSEFEKIVTAPKTLQVNRQDKLVVFLNSRRCDSRSTNIQLPLRSLRRYQSPLTSYWSIRNAGSSFVNVCLMIGRKLGTKVFKCTAMILCEPASGQKHLSTELKYGREHLQQLVLAQSFKLSVRLSVIYGFSLYRNVPAFYFIGII